MVLTADLPRTLGVLAGCLEAAQCGRAGGWRMRDGGAGAAGHAGASAGAAASAEIITSSFHVFS